MVTEHDAPGSAFGGVGRRTWRPAFSVSEDEQPELRPAGRLRALELFCLERDMPLYGYGQMTFQDEEPERGLEADECYAHKDRPIPTLPWKSWSRVVCSTSSKYRGLGIREGWGFEAGVFRVVTLRGDHYEAIATSEVLPEPDLSRIAHFAEHPDQHAALRAFGDAAPRRLMMEPRPSPASQPMGSPSLPPAFRARARMMNCTVGQRPEGSKSFGRQRFSCRRRGSCALTLERQHSTRDQSCLCSNTILE